MKKVKRSAKRILARHVVRGGYGHFGRLGADERD